MRLRLQKYSLEVAYRPGPQMYISDTLSRAALPIPETNPQTPDYVIFRLEKEQESREEIEETNMEECLFTTDERSTRD